MAKTESKMHVRVSEDQERIWRACAESEGVDLSTWVRKTLDYAASSWYKPEINHMFGTLTGRYVKK